MASYTVIQNARLIREGSDAIEQAELLLKHAPDGKSALLCAVEKRISRDGIDGTVTYINARGNLVMPPFADLSVCLREPGAMYKENIYRTCAAALYGGYDTFLAFFEPDGKYSPEEVLAYWHGTPKNPYVKTAFTTQAFAPDGSLASFDILHSYPDTVLTNRFVNSDNRAILLDAMKVCRDRNKTFVLYPRVASLSRGGAANAHIAPRFRVGGIPPVAEAIAVSEGIMLAEEAGCRLHLSGLSTAKSVSLVRSAKKERMPVTADTAPFWFFFTENELFYQGAYAKMMPPLREERDREALIEGIADGTIDAIASHHLPHDRKDYDGRSLADAPFGSIGLETVFPATVEALLSRGRISIMRLYELLSAAPKRILGEMGVTLSGEHTLAVGKTPHFNIVSLDSTVSIDRDFFHGRALNTPFLSHILQGRVEYIFRNGIRV